ncbi:MAG: peptidoglycan DD-metalloendopeptidase family protein, partial [Patescibacteria group bacterium]
LTKGVAGTDGGYQEGGVSNGAGVIQNQPCTTTNSNPIVTTIGTIEATTNRRVGICDDGLYKVNSYSVDSAGNYLKNTDGTIQLVSRIVERDTVSPALPSLEITNILDPIDQGQVASVKPNFLKLNLVGEAKTTAKIEITNSNGGSQTINQVIDNSGNYSNNNLIGALPCGNVKIDVKVTLIDRAGNLSESVTKSIVTKECPACATYNVVDKTISNTTTNFQAYGENAKGFVNPLGNSSKPNFPFGYSTAYFNNSRLHAGVDYSVPVGTPIFAIKAGKVVYAGTDSTGSITTIIDHGDSNLGKIYSLYAHQRNLTITNGQNVNAGQQIGTVGMTGDTTGPHLHLEIRVKNHTPGHSINPMTFLDGTNSSSDTVSTVKSNEISRVDQVTTGNLSSTQSTHQGCRVPDLKTVTQSNGIGSLEEKKDLVGTKENPYGTLTNKDLQKTSIKATKDLRYTNDNLNKEETRTNNLQTEALITYYEKLTDLSGKSRMAIYGVAKTQEDDLTIHKTEIKQNCINNLFTVFRDECQFLSSETEVGSSEQKIQKLEVLIKKEDPNNPNTKEEKAKIINTTTDGRFRLEVLDINFNDIVTINTMLSGKYDNFFDCYKCNNKTLEFAAQEKENQKLRLIEIVNKTTNLVTGTIEDNILVTNPKTRDTNVRLNIYPEKQKSTKQNLLRTVSESDDIWIVSHGMNNNNIHMNQVAESIYNKLERDNQRNTVVLTLDWSDGAKALTPNLTDQFIYPTAKAIINRLKQWGLKDGSKVNLAGHSMGTIMSAELASVTEEVYNKKPNRMILLDPPRSMSNTVGGGDFTTDDNTGRKFSEANGYALRSNSTTSLVASLENGTQGTCGN